VEFILVIITFRYFMLRLRCYSQYRHPAHKLWTRVIKWTPRHLFTSACSHIPFHL